jgi:hypothetical protein
MGKPKNGVPVIEPRGGGDLAILDQLPVSQYSDDVFDKVASGSGFLPRLMLYGSNSNLVKEEKVQIGYSLVTGKDSYTYLGRECNILPLGWRPKAMEIGDSVITSHDISSIEFQRIKARADNEKDSGCMYGPEYLVWIPDLKKFATFLMGSTTSRNESPKLKALLKDKKAATLKTKLYSNKDYKWHGPEVIACSTPFDLPVLEEILEVVNTFNNPKESDVEGVDPEQAGTARDR